MKDTRILAVGPCYIGRRNMSRSQSEFDRVLNEIVSIAIDREVDAVVQSGVLFGTKSPTRESVRRLRDSLAELRDADIPFYQIPGERDLKMDIPENLSEYSLLNTLDSPEMVGDVALAGTKPGEKIQKQMSEISFPAEANSRVTVLHSAVHPPINSSGSVDIQDIRYDQDEDLDLIIAGNKRGPSEHHFSAGELPFDIISPGPTEPILSKGTVSDGSPYPTSVIEIGLSQDGIETAQHELPHRTLSIIELRVSEGADAQAIWEEIPQEKVENSAVLLYVIKEEGSDIAEKLSSILENKTDAFSVKTWEYSGDTPEEGYELSIDIDEGKIDNNTSAEETTTEGSNKRESADSHIDEEYKKSILDVAEGMSFDLDDVESKVSSLVDRGVSKEEAYDIVEEYISGLKTGSGLYSISGLGPVTGYELRQSDIYSIEELADTTPEELNDVTFPGGRVEDILGQARNKVDSNRFDEDTEGAGVGGQKTSTDISPNPLPEYYDSIREVKEAIEVLSASPSTEFELSAPPTDPFTQYYLTLDAILQGIPGVFVGYGILCQRLSKRKSKSILKKYRSEYGDGRWILDYQVINVQQPNEGVAEILDQGDSSIDNSKVHRPIPPGLEEPLRVVVDSKEDLLDSIEILKRFPAYPEGGSVNSDMTVPAWDIYYEVLEGLADEHLIKEESNAEKVDSPVAEASPDTEDEIEEKLPEYEKLVHLFNRVDSQHAALSTSLPVFALDFWQKNNQPFYNRILDVKEDNPESVDYFVNRLRDLIHTRFHKDRWSYDYIAVCPGHEKGSLSFPLRELAQESVEKTPIKYSPLLKRTKTTERQRQKDREERLDMARQPTESLDFRSTLDGERVILLDDIFTTGASMMAGAHMLKEGGASQVIGVALGLTPGDSLEDVKKIKDRDIHASEIISGV